MSDTDTKTERTPEADPIPGLVLFFYLALIYWFFLSVAGCAGWNVVIGPSPRNPSRERALPADSQTCEVEYRPWNETCDNP